MSVRPPNQVRRTLAVGSTVHSGSVLVDLDVVFDVDLDVDVDVDVLVVVISRVVVVVEELVRVLVLVWVFVEKLHRRVEQYPSPPQVPLCGQHDFWQHFSELEHVPPAGQQWLLPG